jgi:hypothetical protein
MDHVTATPRLTPLLIGRQRVYFGHRTPENGYDLVAYEIHTRVLLYQVPLIAHIANGDHGRLGGWRKRRDALELIQHGGNELIIQFNSNRLVSYEFSCHPQGHFAIINGRNGQIIQHISWDGFEGRPTAAWSNSTTLALVDSVYMVFPEHPRDVVRIQTFLQQPDGSFVRMGVQMVTEVAGVVTGDFAVHPFTFQAFRVRGGWPPRALTLSPDEGVDHCCMMNAVVQQASLGATVDKYYSVTAAPRLTLPPRWRSNGHNPRREFPVRKESNYGSLVLVDERRLIFKPAWLTDDAIYLFDFTPQW